MNKLINRIVNKFKALKQEKYYDFDGHCCYCGCFLARIEKGLTPQNKTKDFITFWGIILDVPKKTFFMCKECFDDNVDDNLKRLISDTYFNPPASQCYYCKSTIQFGKHYGSKVQYSEKSLRYLTICQECHDGIFNNIKSNIDIGKYLPDHNPNINHVGNSY